MKIGTKAVAPAVREPPQFGLRSANMISSLRVASSRFFILWRPGGRYLSLMAVKEQERLVSSSLPSQRELRWST